MLPLTSVGRPDSAGIKRSTRRSSSGMTLYLVASIRKAAAAWPTSRGFPCQIVCLGPVCAPVVQLPRVVVKRRQLGAHGPRRAVPRHGAPALIVDAAVAEHLEVLHVVPLRLVLGIERVEHARTFIGALRYAVHLDRLGNAGHFEHGRRHVDDVRELRAQSALLFDALGPVHDGAVACPAPVRRHLLGPLVRRVHRPGPAHGIVVVRLGLPHLSMFAARNSGVSIAPAIPLSVMNSLKVPLGVPSAEAPLSPMMT